MKIPPQTVAMAWVTRRDEQKGKRRSAVAAAEQRRIVEPGEVGLPGVRPSQTLDRGEFRLSAAFDLQGTVQQVGMVFPQPHDLRLLAGRTKETGTLQRHGQAGLGDDLPAAG